MIWSLSQLLYWRLPLAAKCTMFFEIDEISSERGSLIDFLWTTLSARKFIVPFDSKFDTKLWDREVQGSLPSPFACYLELRLVRDFSIYLWQCKILFAIKQMTSESDILFHSRWTIALMWKVSCIWWVVSMLWTETEMHLWMCSSLLLAMFSHGFLLLID